MSWVAPTHSFRCVMTVRERIQSNFEQAQPKLCVITHVFFAPPKLTCQYANGIDYTIDITLK